MTSRLRSRPVAALLAALLVAGVLGAVYAGQRLAIRWAQEEAENRFPQALDYFSAERIDAVLDVAEELTGDGETAYSVKLANDGSASIAMCGTEGLTSYDVSATGGTVRTGGGSSCSGGFSPAEVGSAPMIAAVHTALDPDHHGLVTVSYDAFGGLSPVIDVVPHGQALLRYTLDGTRVGKIIDPLDAVDVQAALDNLLLTSGIDAVQTVCVRFDEPEVSIAGGTAASAGEPAAAVWRFTSFSQRMPSQTKTSDSFAVEQIDLSAAVDRAPQISAVFDHDPAVRRLCVEATSGPQPLVRYEVMNGLGTVTHQVWTDLEGTIVAQE